RRPTKRDERADHHHRNRDAHGTTPTRNAEAVRWQRRVGDREIVRRLVDRIFRSEPRSHVREARRLLMRTALRLPPGWRGTTPPYAEGLPRTRSAPGSRTAPPPACNRAGDGVVRRAGSGPSAACL